MMRKLVTLLGTFVLVGCGEKTESSDNGAAGNDAGTVESETKPSGESFPSDNGAAGNDAGTVESETKPAGEPFPKLSPFTQVSCHDDNAVVVFSGKRYELISIDGLPAMQILEFCHKTYAARWEKRFAEDLVEVLSGMGKTVGGSVNLVLKDLDNDKVIKVSDAPMTTENRRSVWEKRH
ncbi:hypothetical protein N9096_00550 [bacterium]|nr:hypothetical protein [bacterium]MDB4730993.1 hypothetical protein [Akkermansiaceae bacterium]